MTDSKNDNWELELPLANQSKKAEDEMTKKMEKLRKCLENDNFEEFLAEIITASRNHYLNDTGNIGMSHENPDDVDLGWLDTALKTENFTNDDHDDVHGGGGHNEAPVPGLTDAEKQKSIADKSDFTELLENLLNKKRFGARFFWTAVQTHVKNEFNPTGTIKDDVSPAMKRASTGNVLLSANDDRLNVNLDKNGSPEMKVGISSEEHMFTKPDVPFNNLTLAYREDPLSSKIISPKTYSELISAIKYGIDHGMVIKPFGTQYAFNDITFTAGIHIDVHTHLCKPKLKIEMTKDFKLLNENGNKIAENRNMIISEAGTTTEMIHLKTWPVCKGEFMRIKTRDKDGKAYKMLPYMPGFHGLTIGGTINVGAEGQGRLDAAVQNMVLSLHMLSIRKNTHSGKLYVKSFQIEPATGSIHDMKRWRENEIAKYPNEEDVLLRTELIQDDEVFNSVVCSVGTCGVVYSYHLRLVDAINVVQHRYLINWSDYKLYYPYIRLWEHMNIFDKNNNMIPGMLYNSNIYMSPYQGDFGDFSAPCSESWDGDKIPVLLTLNITTNEDVKEEPTMENSGSAYGPQSQAFVAAMAITWISNSLLLNRFLGICQYLALWTEAHEPLIMTALNSFSLGAPACVPVDVAGMVVKETTILDAIEEWIGLFNKRDIIGNFVNSCTSPCGITYCDKTYGYISMGHGDTIADARAWIEMPYCDFTHKNKSIGQTRGMYDSMNRTYDILMKAPYHGRYHLGLYHTWSAKDWTNENLYPYFNIFLQNYKKFNEYGFFRNKFTIETELDKLAGFPDLSERNQENQYWRKAIGLYEDVNKTLSLDFKSVSVDPANANVETTWELKARCLGVLDCVKNIPILKKEESEAGWMFFLLGIICSSIAWYIGLSAIGTPLADAFYPRNETTFYKKLCCDMSSDITQDDIWEYATVDMLYYIFAGILLHVGSCVALSRHAQFNSISHIWWWLVTGLMWPLAWVLGDVIVLNAFEMSIIKDYLPWLFATTCLQGLFIGLAQWPVLYYILGRGRVALVAQEGLKQRIDNKQVEKAYDPKGRIRSWFVDTAYGSWWVLQSIFAWGIQLPAGCNFFFFALVIPPYKLEWYWVVAAIVVAVTALTLIVQTGGYGDTGFCPYIEDIDCS